MELLAIACDPGLTGVDRSMNGSNHVEKFSVIVWISDVVEPWMLEGLFTSQSVCWIHLK